MADSLRARSGDIDVLSLARQLGTPVALVSAATGEGLEAVDRFITSAMQRPQPAELPILHDLRDCRQWAEQINIQSNYRKPLAARMDPAARCHLPPPSVGPADFFRSGGWPSSRRSLPPASLFRKILQDGLDYLGTAAAPHIHNALIRSLLMDGAWKGVSSVLVFLPQILLLFLLIGVLEDSGYLARAAVIADRTMSRFGLNGKAFIPLLSAYACAVPAIMATRTIENKRDRLATIMVAPFMTCSARLPVYTMVIAAFVPNVHIAGVFFGSRALAMLGLYLIGFLAALFTARVLKSSILKSKDVPFLLELPPYRWPTLRSLGHAPLRPLESIRMARRNRNPGGFAAAGSSDQSSAPSGTAAGHSGQHRRTRRPFHYADHRSARVQLEDRRRLADLARRPRGHRGHARHALWRRSRTTRHEPATGIAPAI